MPIMPTGARLNERGCYSEMVERKGCAREIRLLILRRLVDPFLPERARRSASCGSYGGTDRSVNQLFRAKMLGNGRA